MSTQRKVQLPWNPMVYLAGAELDMERDLDRDHESFLGLVVVEGSQQKVVFTKHTAHQFPGES